MADPTDEQVLRDLARRFFDSIESGDFDTLLECYAPDAHIWNNVDDTVQTREQNVAGIAGFASRCRDRQYVDRKVHLLPNGYVHQHLLRATRMHDDVVVEMPACLVCEVVDGRITRLEEYFDSADVAEIAKYK